MRLFEPLRALLNPYCVPCLLLLVVRAYALTADADGEGAASSGAQTLLLLLSYSLAFVNVLRNGRTSARFMSELAPLAALSVLAILTSLASIEPIIAITHAIHFAGLFFVAVNASLWARSNSDVPMDVISLIVFAVGVLSILYVFFVPETGLSFADMGPWASRWTGATANPNFLGALAFVLLWTGLYYLSKRDKSLAIYGLVSCVLAGFLLVGSDSRTAIVSALFLTAAFLLMRRGGSIDRRSFMQRMILAMAGAIIIPVALSASGPGGLGSYLSSETREGASDSLSGRPEIWRLGLEAFAQRPLFGWGYDDLSTFWHSHTYIERFVHFHNGFLNAAVFGGIVGLAILIWTLWRMLASAYALWPRYPFFAKMSLLFYLSNIVYNLTEAGFNRSVLVWPVMVIVWAITVARMSDFSIRRGLQVSPRQFGSQVGN